MKVQSSEFKEEYVIKKFAAIKRVMYLETSDLCLRWEQYVRILHGRITYEWWGQGAGKKKFHPQNLLSRSYISDPLPKARIRVYWPNLQPEALALPLETVSA